MGIAQSASRYFLLLCVTAGYFAVSALLLGAATWMEGGAEHEVFLYSLAGPMSFLFPVRRIEDPMFYGFLHLYFASTLIFAVLVAVLFHPRWRHFLQLVRFVAIVIIWLGVGFVSFMAHSLAT